MVSVGVIGYGYWGPNLVRNFQESGVARVAAVSDLSQGRLDLVRGRYPTIATTPDHAALITRSDVDAVAIATPVGTHFDLALAALRAGKHVFVEKPFTMTKASAEAAVAACRAAGVVMALGHNRRFLPAVAEMKAMLADGRLGTLLHVEGQFSGPGAVAYKPGMWRADRAESPLGGMGGMGIHMVDMFINLAGRIAEVTVQSHARVLDNGLDDTTAGLFRFESGATANFATLALAPRLWRVGLFGTDAWAVLHGHESLTTCQRDGTPETRQFPVTDIEHAELTAFAAAVAGGAPYPLPLEDAIHGVAVYEAMIGAAASGSTYRVA